MDTGKEFRKENSFTYKYFQAFKAAYRFEATTKTEELMLWDDGAPDYEFVDFDDVPVMRDDWLYQEAYERLYVPWTAPPPKKKHMRKKRTMYDGDGDDDTDDDMLDEHLLPSPPRKRMKGTGSGMVRVDSSSESSTSSSSEESDSDSTTSSSHSSSSSGDAVSVFEDALEGTA